MYMRLTLQRGELKKNSFDVYSNFKSHRPVLRSTFHIWGGEKKKKERERKKSARLKLKITRYLSNYT